MVAGSQVIKFSQKMSSWGRPMEEVELSFYLLRI
jgi:hypothetical protein